MLCSPGPSAAPGWEGSGQGLGRACRTLCPVLLAHPPEVYRSLERLKETILQNHSPCVRTPHLAPESSVQKGTHWAWDCSKETHTSLKVSRSPATLKSWLLSCNDSC